MPTPRGTGYDFSGAKSGLLIPDLAPLALTGSMTVSVWIRPRSYANDGPGAQIFFRGDDRVSLDPIDLVIHSDGTIWFAVMNEQGLGVGVGAELPLNQWTHVTASFEDTGMTREHTLKLWLNGRLVAFAETTRSPFSVLDRRTAPGVGIGNVQNDKGPHNQPFNGTLCDLRLYDAALEPADAGFGGGFAEPPEAQASAFAIALGRDTCTSTPSLKTK